MAKYPFSKSSVKKLKGIHPDMVRFAYEIAELIDCKIVYGVRTAKEQRKLFNKGRSTFDGIQRKSKHQKKSDGYGYALDILPLPKGVNMYDDKDPENKLRWAQFDGMCHAVAHKLNIKVRTGFKWRSDMMSSLKRKESSNTLPDGNHVELVV
jgi:hypothetical protein